MRIAVQELGLAHLWVIYPGRERYLIQSNITALPLTQVQHMV
jgi:hypothetical protein